MELPSLINKQRSKILNVAVAILAFIIANNIYKNQTKNIQLLKEQIDAEVKKNDMLSNISQAEKIINAYKNLLNKKDISAAIGTTSNMARESNVNIIVVKPAPLENYPVYIKHPFSLVINAGSFHAIGKFINKLEGSPDVYFVDRIDIRPVGKIRESDKEYKLDADLTISTIIFKNKDSK